jgi:gas vesicle protein
VVTESDRIRAEIAATRSDLADDVSALADRTSPKRMAQRRWDSVKTGTQSVRDKVMGASAEAKETVSDKASDVASAVRDMPQAVTRQAQGSPIGAGLIAFGVGLVAAALIPETRQERRLGAQVADRAGEVMEPVRALASDLGDDIKSSASQAASELGQATKDAAADAAEQTKHSAQSAKEEITR